MSDKSPPAYPGKPGAKPRAAASKKTPSKKAAPSKAPAEQPAVKKAAARKTTAKKTAAGQRPAKQQSAAEAAKAPPSTQNDAGAAPSADLIRVPMAVRWRDLDAFNHVNNSKYLSYLEEARLHWMMGVPGQGMDDHVAPVVAAAQLNYRRPITWPAEVVVELFVERLGNTSLSIGHRIVDDEDRSIVYCDGNVVMVWIDRDSGRAAELPHKVREACSR